MTQLTLRDAQKASLYFLPARDMTETEALAALVAGGMTPNDAAAHLRFAVSAGAYERSTAEVTSKPQGAPSEMMGETLTRKRGQEHKEP